MVIGHCIKIRIMNQKKLLVSGALLSVAALVLLNSCKTIPKGVKAVEPFNANRYLGKWYEIARMNYRFEKNLNNVTAEYSFRDDGKIKVLNKGYNFKKEKWQQSVGKAKFVDDKTIGKLKVSFFGPFYAGYNVIAIDEDYKYALVAGKDLSYLWILSRDITMPENIKEAYLQKAKELGFNISDLVWVEQNKK